MFNGFDIICIIICIVFGLIGYKRGAIKTLISFGGFIASFVIAWIFSPQMGEWLMGLGIFQNLIEVLNIKGISEGLISGGLQNIMGSFNGLETLLGATEQALSQGGEIVFQSLVKGIAGMISFGIIMMLVNLLVLIIQRIFSVINHIPIIGGINRLIGLCFGLILGGTGIFVVAGIIIGMNLFTLGQMQFSFLESSEIVRLLTPWITKIVGL